MRRSFMRTFDAADLPSQTDVEQAGALATPLSGIANSRTTRLVYVRRSSDSRFPGAAGLVDGLVYFERVE
jgi:hypothetical protein